MSTQDPSTQPSTSQQPDQRPPLVPQEQPFHLPKPTHRPREEPKAELEATTELKLGEFQDVPTLSLSEARLVINKVLDIRRNAEGEGGRPVTEEPEALTKTLDYLEIFARFKDTENIEEVEKLLSAHTELELFERSQLGSLCCDNAEEAKSLIPSLQNKISDSELQELLDEMTKLRNFVE
ncbi:polymerase II polypeptide D [Ascosphaera apis ARSEF 7405]|uniref:Polymerase II polypeptide D n=1 Tax=Ascosphaera apis ARSEF 7405 TaxID=392613 RepID=A0A166NB96_9EURO|nr:polymerase II polypeptide D [Ascosphaera apis ARSEF 7405]